MLPARAAAARAVSGPLPLAAAGPARSARAGLGAARRSGHAAGTGLQDLILREYVRPLVGALQTIER